jgi:hypothetical protein
MTKRVCLAYWYNVRNPESNGYELSDDYKIWFTGTKEECYKFAEENDLTIIEI